MDNLAHTIYTSSNAFGTTWRITQQPLGVTDPMVVSFRRWKRGRSLLNRNARWTSAGWAEAQAMAEEGWR